MTDILARGIIAKQNNGQRSYLADALVSAKVNLRDLPWQALDGLDNVARADIQPQFKAATLEKKEFKRLISEDLGWVLDALIDPSTRKSAGAQRVLGELLKLKAGDATAKSFATGLGERYSSLHGWNLMFVGTNAAEVANVIKTVADKDPVLASSLIIDANAAVWGPFADEFAMAIGAPRSPHETFDQALKGLTPEARKVLHGQITTGFMKASESALASHLAGLGIAK
jgi:hypothetical protein